jgi:hypothetical protein
VGERGVSCAWDVCGGNGFFGYVRGLLAGWGFVQWKWTLVEFLGIKCVRSPYAARGPASGCQLALFDGGTASVRRRLRLSKRGQQDIEKDGWRRACQRASPPSRVNFSELADQIITSTG